MSGESFRAKLALTEKKPRDAGREDRQVPLYEYRCADCGSRFELLRRVGQGSEGVACPECGRADVEKEFSTFAGSAAGGGNGGASCSPSGGFT